MLTINIYATGEEHYAAFYPVSDFDEKFFMKNHSDNYYELSDENIDIDMADYDVEATVNLNGKDLQVDDDFVENSSIFQGNKPSLRLIVGADDNDVAVYWLHEGTTYFEITWDDVEDFHESKLKIHFFERDDNGQTVFNRMTYDGKEANSIDGDFAAEYGFDGPKVLFPGDQSTVI